MSDHWPFQGVQEDSCLVAMHDETYLATSRALFVTSCVRFVHNCVTIFSLPYSAVRGVEQPWSRRAQPPWSLHLFAIRVVFEVLVSPRILSMQNTSYNCISTTDFTALKHGS